jgi:hypothetical protein
LAGPLVESTLKTLIKPSFNGTSWDVDNHFLIANNIKDSAEVIEIVKQIQEKAASADRARQQGLYSTEVMVRHPRHRLKMLHEYTAQGLMSVDKAWKIARDTWLNLDEVYPHIEGWELFFSEFGSGSDVFMTAHEKAHLDQLPDEIKIYRGYDRKLKRMGLSWTMSKFIASQYADRFKSTILAQGVVKKSEVIAYVSTRGHHEIILKSRASVLNQRAVSSVNGEDAMRWVIKYKGKRLL